MSGKELQRRLSEPFAAHEVKWRINKIDGNRGLAVPYVDSRCIMDRLDEVVGPFGWSDRYLPWHTFTPKPTRRERENGEELQPVASQLCELSIYDEERKAWVSKVDGAENTDYETVKGGISDSFKRVAVLWGLGRYLYRIGGKWVEIDKKQQITAQGMQELRSYYETQMQRLGLVKMETANGTYLLAAVKPAPMGNGRTGYWLTVQMPDGKQQMLWYCGSVQGLAPGLHLIDLQIAQRQGASGPYCEATRLQLAA